MQKCATAHFMLHYEFIGKLVGEQKNKRRGKCEAQSQSQRQRKHKQTHTHIHTQAHREVRALVSSKVCYKNIKSENFNAAAASTAAASKRVGQKYSTGPNTTSMSTLTLTLTSTQVRWIESRGGFTRLSSSSSTRSRS